MARPLAKFQKISHCKWGQCFNAFPVLFLNTNNSENMNLSTNILLVLVCTLFLATACHQDKPTSAEDTSRTAETTAVEQSVTSNETPSANSDTGAESETPTASNLSVGTSQSGNKLTVTPYSEFPPEIDGCSCYYSTSQSEFKKSNWIYTYDYQILAFMNIDGRMNRLRLNQSLDRNDGSSERKLSNEDYQVVVDVKQVGQVDETFQHSGTIKVTASDGKTFVSPIYGECGC